MTTAQHIESLIAAGRSRLPAGAKLTISYDDVPINSWIGGPWMVFAMMPGHGVNRLSGLANAMTPEDAVNLAIRKVLDQVNELDRHYAGICGAAQPTAQEAGR